MTLSVEMIRAARERIRSAVYHSPCPYSLSLSRLCGAEIYCKLDHLQMTGSFKERGARHKLMLLSSEQQRAGVIAASAGNHALGLAYHGELLHIPVTVVMPRFAPLVKVSNCRSFGAEVILHGETFDEARKLALELAERRGLLYVNGFDDEAVIAGAGTIGLEILEDVPDVDAIVAPAGGGGMLAGLIVATEGTGIKIIGAEPEHAPTVSVSLEKGAVTRVQTRPTLADGLAVAEMGKLCFDILRGKLRRMVLVDETAIAKAVLRLLELEKMVVEGAGAVGLAAMMERERHGLRELEGKKVVLVLSGGNVDVRMIGRVIDRGLASDGRLARFTANIHDRPGTLARLLQVVAEAGGSIQEVRHDRQFGPADVGLVRVYLVVETRDAQHVADLRTALEKAGVGVVNETEP